MIDSAKYAHAVGRVRVAENFMMDSIKLLRFAEAADVNDAIKVLVECRYIEHEDYTVMLDNELFSLYSYIKTIIPEPTVFNAFFYKHDVHNIKVLLKAEFLNKPYDDIASNLGVFEYEDLKEYIRERDFTKLPETIGEKILQVIEEFSKTNDPQLVDLILDKAYYTYFNSVLLKARDPFLKEFVTVNTDLLNIKAFLRIKRVFKSELFLDETILERGSISLLQYKEFFNSDPEVFFNYMKNTRYAKVVEKGDVEKNCDDLLTEFLQSYRYDPYGIAAVVGYMSGKETEIKNARIVMMGKTNGIDKDKTKERLRMCYV